MVNIGDFDIKMKNGLYNISWKGKDCTRYGQNYKNKKYLLARLRKLQPPLGKSAISLVNVALGINRKVKKLSLPHVDEGHTQEKKEASISKIWEESWNTTQENLDHIEGWGEQTVGVEKEAFEKMKSDFDVASQLKREAIDVQKGLARRLMNMEIHIKEIGMRLGELHLRQNEITSYGVDIEKTSKRAQYIEKAIIHIEDHFDKVLLGGSSNVCKRTIRAFTTTQALQ